MGRGLSDLQRWILREAARKERLYHCEVLAGFFGWQPRLKTMFDYRGYPWGQQFSVRHIGEKRYRSTMASLSRACYRLQARGLAGCWTGAYCKWAWVEITPAGREWLSVNKVPSCDFVNRYDGVVVIDSQARSP